jgi:hypothetical protein
MAVRTIFLYAPLLSVCEDEHKIAMSDVFLLTVKPVVIWINIFTGIMVLLFYFLMLALKVPLSHCKILNMSL